jgi:very-short-patch-repair endonuclease
MHCGKKLDVKRADAERRRFCSVSCYRKHKGETSIETLVRRQFSASGIPFVQEHRIGRWSVDFLVADRIVVEVDGTYWHSLRGVRARDVKRDKMLTEMGFVVIRLDEQAVKKDPAVAIRALSGFGLDLSRDRTPHGQLSLPFAM